MCSWVEWHRPAAGTVLTDVTSGWAALMLAGPHSHALVHELAGRKVEFGDVLQRFDLGYAPVGLAAFHRVLNDLQTLLRGGEVAFNVTEGDAPSLDSLSPAARRSWCRSTGSIRPRR